MNRKLILFLIVLAAICTVSYAAAAEDSALIVDDNATVTESLAADETVDMEESANDDFVIGEEKTNQNDGTYRNIQRQIDEANEGDTIYLNGTYYCDYLINVNKTVKIVGLNGGAEIRYNSSNEYTSPFFNIEKGASNVVLTNIRFVGGIFLWGGAITWQGDNGKMINCDFIDNTARGKNAIGGAVLILGENCTIADSTFRNNIAYLHGGAIMCNGTGCIITNCEFTGNVANGVDGHGGAIVFWADNGLVYNCNFTNNHCTDFGGAISVLKNNIRVTNCEFNSNFVTNEITNNKQGGGAIFSASNKLIVDNCTFIANSAPKAYGGAISLSENDTIKKSFFRDNYAYRGNDLVYYSANVISNHFVIDYNESVEDAVYGIPVQQLLNFNNILDKIKVNSTVVFSAGMIFEYASSGSILVTVEGGTIDTKNIRVLNHTEAKIVYNESTQIITVSNLDVGNYILRVTTTPDENHTAVDGDLNVTVKKATAVISASDLTVALKSDAVWAITVIDSRDNKTIPNMDVTLKVYTGSKYDTVHLKTDANGVASYRTGALGKGTHKVEVSINHKGYNFVPVTSSISVIKQQPLVFKLQKRSNTKGGSLLSYRALDKKTKKGLKGIKIEVRIYTGNTYKSYFMKTKKIKDAKKKKVYVGAFGFSTNDFSAGKHKVVILPASIKYKGSVTTYIKIKKSATKGPKFFRVV